MAGGNDNVLEFVLRATDEYSRILRDAQGALKATGQAGENLKKQQVSFGQEAKTAWTELNSAIGVVRTALALVDKAYQAVLGTTITYAKQIRDLQRLTGGTAEQMSKLVQVASNVNVEFGSLQMGLRILAMKGLEPTLDNMGELSDQFLALAPGVERTRFAFQNFGRAGLRLLPMLELGSAAIAEMGDEAERLGLVLSQDAVDQARQFEIELNTLQSTIMGLKVEVGTGLLPIIVLLASRFTALLKAGRGVREVLDEHITSFALTADSATEYNVELLRLWHLTGDWTVLLRLQSQAQWDATEATKGQAAETARLTGLASLYTAELEPTTEELQAYNASMASGVSVGINAARELGTYNENLTAITRTMQENKGRQDELNAVLERRGWLTRKEREELEELKGAYGDQAHSLAQLEAAHETAFKQMMMDVVAQRLAVDGWTDAEITGYAALMVQSKLWTQEQADAFKDTQGAITDFLEGGPLGVLLGLTGPDLTPTIDTADAVKEIHGFLSRGDVQMYLAMTQGEDFGGWTPPPGGETPDNLGGGGTDASWNNPGLAGGGRLTGRGVTAVGEVGEEWVLANGVVLPADVVRDLKRRGVRPGRGMATGGNMSGYGSEDFGGAGSGGTTASEAASQFFGSPNEPGGNPDWNWAGISSVRGGGGGGGDDGGGGGGGGGATAVLVAQAAAAAASAAVATQTQVLVAALPSLADISQAVLAPMVRQNAAAIAANERTAAILASILAAIRSQGSLQDQTQGIGSVLTLGGQ